MLNHISLGVKNLQRSLAFYDAGLGALGYCRVWTGENSAGYGVPGGEDALALFERESAGPPGSGFHLALTAPNREAVHAFFDACLMNGGRDLGPPGPRPQYGPRYYAAFTADPDGYKLEAVHNGA